MFDIIKKIIIRNQERIQGIELTERSLSIDLNANYVIVGPRRAGKTYFLYQIIQKIVKSGSIDQILYINFEDERLLELKPQDLSLILEAYEELYDETPKIFFDEIQNIDQWQTFCRRLADEGYQIYITGSNAKMLSQEMASSLGGRFLIKEIFPLSFKEYLNFNDLDVDAKIRYSKKLPILKRHFNEYLLYGGFPELMKYSDKRDYLNNLFKKVFYGDIIIRYNLKNKKALELLVKKIAESLKDEISYTRIKNLLKAIGIKVGTNTVIDYLGYLQESFLLLPLQNTVTTFSQREMKKKYYFIDVGLLNLFLLGDSGKLLENLVFNQLYRVHLDKVFYYKRRTETDFYLPEQKQLIQVSFDLSNGNTRDREVSSLQESMKDLKIETGLILTNSHSKEELKFTNQTITIMPTWQWLLGLD